MRRFVAILLMGLCWSSYSQNLKVLDSLLTSIAQSDNDSLKARNYVKVGNQYRRATKIDSAKIYALKAEEFALKSKDPENMAYVYLFLGAIEYYKWNAGEATMYYQKVDSILNLHGIVNRNLYVSYADRAELVRRSIRSEDERAEAYKQALFYYEKGLEVAQELKDSLDISRSLMRIASVKRGLGDFDTAKEYLDEIKANYFDHTNKAYYYNEYGNLYLKMRDTAKTIVNRTKAYEIQSKSKSSFVRANAQKDQAFTHFLAKEYRKGIEQGLQSVAYFSSLDPPNYGRLSGLYGTLSRNYKASGNYEKAYEYLSLLSEVSDTLDARDRKDLATELEKKYQTEQKEKEIALLAATNEKVEAEKKNQRNLLAGGLLLTTTTGIFLFLGFRNRKKTNDKLRELDSAKSTFFANISHEFRTPLSLISGPIEEQLINDSISVKDRDNLKLAKRNTKRLVTLVDQLLDLSKLEAGQLALRVQQGDLAVFLRSLVGTFEYLAQQNNQTYETTIDLKEGDFWYDSDALEKIITNLISNALKYSPTQEKITVGANVKNGLLELTVSNSGVELSTENLGSIFDRFSRVEETKAGTGIGLAHTKELVQLHKGVIKASSQDNWIAFMVEIPVMESAFKADEKQARTEAKSSVKKEQEHQGQTLENSDVFSLDDQPILLIVDDNADLRQYLSSLFKDSHAIHTAQDGKEGYSKALDLVPDIIITDLMMPEEDGITFTANCKENEVTAHIPVIMLTAKAGDENEILGLETGADAYITKPFNTELLKTTVTNLQEIRTKLQKRFSQEVVLLPKDVATNSADERFIQNLKEVVDTSLIESDFNAEAFAQALGMSRMQLHRKLKALTGLSATEFIRSQRLKLAAAMLKKSDINVSQVGYAVGFNNHSYFTKCFKEQYGVSPSDYSKKA